MSYIRERYRFALLRTTLIDITGTRMSRIFNNTQKLSEVDFNIIESLHQ